MATTIDARPGHMRWMTIGAAVGLLLLVPAIAMQFTSEVQWTAFDFVAAAVLLGGAASGCELAVRRLRGRARVIAVGVVLAVAALLWAQGAVGIV